MYSKTINYFVTWKEFLVKLRFRNKNKSIKISKIKIDLRHERLSDKF